MEKKVLTNWKIIFNNKNKKKIDTKFIKLLINKIIPQTTICF